MPWFIRRSSEPGDAEYVEREPEWADRPLTRQELSNCLDVVALWLSKSRFTPAHIAQILFPNVAPRAGRRRVEDRLARMESSFRSGGFELGAIP